MNCGRFSFLTQCVWPDMEDRSGSETLRLVASMPSDKTAQVEDLFATSTNNKPLRTYSAKGKNRFSSSLPTLRYQPPPPNPGPRLKRFRVGRAKSWELKQTRPVAIEQLPTVQTEQEDAKSVHGRKASEEISRSSLGDAEDESMFGCCTHIIAHCPCRRVIGLIHELTNF